MKRIPILLIVLIATKTFAQQCESKMDPFSNESFLAYEWKPGGFQTIYLESKRDTVQFHFRAVELGSVEFTVPKGAEVLIKLENGEVIKLLTLSDTRSVPYIIPDPDPKQQLVFTAYYLKVILNAEDLNKLAKHKVTHLHCPDLYGGIKRFNDKELRNKWQQYLMEGAQCILRGN